MNNNNTDTLSPKTPLLIHLYLIGTAILWGISWPVGKIVAEQAQPFHAAMWRFSASSIALLVWLLFIERRLPKISLKQGLYLLLGAIIGIFAYSYCFMAGLQTVSASRASLIVAFYPSLTTLLACLLFKERLNALMVLGMIIALLGSFNVLSHGKPWTAFSEFSTHFGKGELFLLGCTVTWSVYSVLGKVLMKGLSPLTAITYSCCFGCILLTLAAFQLEPPQPFWWDLSSYNTSLRLSVLFTGVGATGLAYVWYFKGIEAVGAGMAANYMTLVSVFAVLSAVLWFNETPDLSLWIGTVATVIGVLLMNYGRSKL